MAAKAGKKGKKKGTTMALTDFLSDETGNSPAPGSSYVLTNKTMDWASEMEEADFGDSDPSYSMSAVDRAKLPTAPKASRGPEDLENVPTSPPFTAFIGNLPYEATDEKIREFFRNLPIDNVRLPEDNGRLRGFGYVQFDTRDALIEALLMKDESFGGRKVRIDLAGESQGDNRKDGGRGHRDDGQPDRTEGDWRRSEVKQEPSFNDRRGDDRRDDRGGGFNDFRRDDRGSFDDRRGGGGGFDDRRGGGFDDRRGGGFDDRRGGGGFDDRRGGGGGGGRFEDRSSGFGRRDDRGFGRDRFDDRRDDRFGGGGGGGGRDRFDDRDGGRRQFGSSFRRDDRGDDKAWERGPPPATGDRERSYGGDRGGFDRTDRTERYGGQDSRPPPAAVSETPTERPRLQLQPRSKPAGNEKSEEKPSKSASIFGSAKPVDTAQREREIEEKLQKQKDPGPVKSSLESRGYGGSRGYEEPREKSYDMGNKENKNVASTRRRSGSDDESQRERRSSGSSRSKKGSVSSQTRSRQDSGEQSLQGEVFSGGEEDKSQNAVSPAMREEQVKLVPAPPPKVNIWEKRKSTQVQSPPQKSTEPKAPLEDISSNQPRSPRSPVTSQSIDQSKRQSRSNSQSSQDLTPTKNEVKKDYVPAEPPKENPWMKRRQEREQTSGKKDGPAPASSPPDVSNAWAGRGGGGGERGRGRGGRGGGGGGKGRGETRQKPERKEKALPQSVDEMPKMEDEKSKDFSDGNKFAGLIDDDGGDVAEDSS